MKYSAKLPLLAMAVATIAAFAFTPAPKQGVKGVDYFWYQLATGANPNVATNYTKQTPSGCSSGNNVCAVNAQDDGTGHPMVPASGQVTPDGTYIIAVSKRN